MQTKQRQGGTFWAVLTVTAAVWLAGIGAAWGQTPLVYFITGSGTAFTARKGSITGTELTTAGGVAIQAAVNAIKADAAGDDCTIQFGSGGADVLDIGTAYMTFDGSGTTTWGHITLTGKVTSSVVSGSGFGTLTLRNGVSVNSGADIGNTNTGMTVRNESTEPLVISGGTVSATTGTAISHSSTGTLTISGGITALILQGRQGGFFGPKSRRIKGVGTG